MNNNMHFQGQNNSKMIRKPPGLAFQAVPMLILLAILWGSTTSAQHTVIKSKDKHVVISNGKKHRYHSVHGSSFNLEYNGDIRVTDDDRDIKSISPGGYFEVSKTTFGSKRSIAIESRSGGLRKQYYEGRKELNWEPAGRQWLAEILPGIVRSTGIAAEDRVNRYYRKGGVDAVLDEISRLESDYVKAIYAKTLLDKKGLTTSELAKIVEELGDEIDSDYYLAQVLKENSNLFLASDQVSEAYFEAVTNISSDHYASSILKEAIHHRQPSARSLSKIMEAVGDISSDYYQAVILSEVLELQELNGEMIEEIIETSEDISSDYYQSQVLKKALHLDNLSSGSFESLIEAISDVSSDHYMASVFSDLVENPLENDVQIKIIGLVEDNMSSDHYASEILSKILEEQRLSEEASRDLAEAIEGIGSAHYASSIIMKAAKQDLDKSSLLSLLRSVHGISSDHYRSEALRALAPQVRAGDNDLKDAYLEAARHIRSDTYYAKAIRAID